MDDHGGRGRRCWWLLDGNAVMLVKLKRGRGVYVRSVRRAGSQQKQRIANQPRLSASFALDDLFETLSPARNLGKTHN